jgi:hypothetical protein
MISVDSPVEETFCFRSLFRSETTSFRAASLLLSHIIGGLPVLTIAIAVVWAGAVFSLLGLMTCQQVIQVISGDFSLIDRRSIPSPRSNSNMSLRKTVLCIQLRPVNHRLTHGLCIIAKMKKPLSRLYQKLAAHTIHGELTGEGVPCPRAVRLMLHLQLRC